MIIAVKSLAQPEGESGWEMQQQPTRAQGAGPELAEEILCRRSCSLLPYITTLSLNKCMFTVNGNFHLS